MEALRAAIKKCANPDIQHTFSTIVRNPEADKRDRKTLNKESAREFLHIPGILLTCEECGELKEEKELKRCGAW